MSDTDGVTVRPCDAAPPEPFERAGRKGHRFADGSILWDNGEREYPVSGKTDDQKRAEARAFADGEPVVPQKPGVSIEEVQALERLGAVIANPLRVAELRRGTARANAGKPPAEARSLTPSAAEITSDFRQQAKTLLEREIDRLEELKTLAIAGQIEIHEAGLPPNGRNPPMLLHELVLEAIRVSNSGHPDQLLAQLRKLRRWTAAGSPRIDELPYPPPDGYPADGVAPPMPDPASQEGLNRASQSVLPGGAPTTYPTPQDPLAPPPVAPPLDGDAAVRQAATRTRGRVARKK